MSTQFSLVAIIKIAEGSVDAFKALMNDPNGVPTTRAFPGNILFECTSDINDETTIRIYEKWESKDAWDAYMKFRGETGFADKLSSFISAPPQFIPVSLIA
jgi:quinol monooxygenase YgiN